MGQEGTERARLVGVGRRQRETLRRLRQLGGGGMAGGWVRAQCVGHGVKCRLLAAPRVRVFSVLLYAGYSAVCAVGWCGECGCVGTVGMGVRGVVRGGWVRACRVC
jgi:hypothetical protein